MTKKNNTKESRIAQYREMITGVQANVGTTATIPVRGVATTRPAVVAALQGYVDAAGAVEAARAALEEAVARQDQAEVTANVTYLAVKAYATATFGDKPTTLSTFGLQVPVRTPMSAATKAAAAAKRKATLQARKAALAAVGATAQAETPATPAPAAPETGGSSATTTSKS
ncbi:MAG: hypothetical protein ACRELB_15335 [Polyangiaceae bacterium]